MDELIDKAKAYVAASNAHDVARIKQMLAEDCSYQSTGVGQHEGSAAIAQMMQAFFASNPDVSWQSDNYRQQSDRVTFEFVITIGSNRSAGVEDLYFDNTGKICRIVVQR